jgi:hypothetical protein
VLESLARLEPRFDVALFTSFPHLLAVFQSSFEQGEYLHPGLLQSSQEFLDRMGIGIDLAEHVTCLGDSVFSNYVVAKPSYWSRWQALAELFFDFVEGQGAKLRSLERAVPHDNKHLPLKVFIQERFPSLLLSQHRFEVFVPSRISDFSDYHPQLRPLLASCDMLKRQYGITRDAAYLETFRQTRRRLVTDRRHLSSW